MNTYPYPFPYFKGALWTDNSAISSWQECPREYEYESLFRRKATFTAAALNYGKGMHVALAALALSCGNTYTSADFAKLSKLLDDHFDKNLQPIDDHRTPALAKETLWRYLKTYEVEPWTILEANGFPMVERLVWSPLPITFDNIPINFYGLIDLVVQDASKSVWIVDHKTTSMLGTMFDFDMQMTGQMKGYCWLFNQCFGKMPMGYIVDAIRSLAPSDRALADSAKLEAWWREQFRRLPFYVDAEQVKEWYDTTLITLEEMISHFEKSHWRMNTKSCVGKFGRCQYFDVCSLPQHQRLVSLNSNFFQDNTWTEENLKEKL